MQLQVRVRNSKKSRGCSSRSNHASQVSVQQQSLCISPHPVCVGNMGSHIHGMYANGCEGAQQRSVPIGIQHQASLPGLDSAHKGCHAGPQCDGVLLTTHQQVRNGDVKGVYSMFEQQDADLLADCLITNTSTTTAPAQAKRSWEGGRERDRQRQTEIEIERERAGRGSSKSSTAAATTSSNRNQQQPTSSNRNQQ